MAAFTTIDKPSLYFNTKLYTGNGGTNAITGVGHQPDLVWLKNRSDADGHKLFDSVRGALKVLSSNDTDTESTYANSLASFDTDGFTVGSTADINENNDNIASWNWKAGTTGSGTSTGSGTGKAYSYSVNTTSGFSVIKYVGNGSTGHTIPHHLGGVPDVVLVKCLDQTYNWVMYHSAVGNTKGNYLNLNSAQVDSDSFWNDTTPSSTVFTLGADNATNQNNQNYAAYCFRAIRGFSAFGDYLGNGDALGPFIYTGFKPAWVMNKKYSNTGQWNIQDNKRDPNNPALIRLWADGSDADTSSASYTKDFLSTGFRIRNTNGNDNTNADNYLYMAFAESPIVNTTGKLPTTAR